MIEERAEPSGASGRLSYAILYRADGLADVYLDARVYPLTEDGGWTDYDVCFRVARGIDPKEYGNLEAHIREHYRAWCEIAEVVHWA